MAGLLLPTKDISSKGEVIQSPLKIRIYDIWLSLVPILFPKDLFLVHLT